MSIQKSHCASSDYFGVAKTVIFHFLSCERGWLRLENAAPHWAPPSHVSFVWVNGSRLSEIVTKQPGGPQKARACSQEFLQKPMAQWYLVLTPKLFLDVFGTMGFQMLISFNTLIIWISYGSHEVYCTIK